MSEQLQSDFDKIVKNSKFSNREIQLKKDFLNKFIESGFPNRKQEDWKFLDISQIIKKNISDLSYFIDYSQSNKIDLSTFCLLYTSPSPRDRTRSRMPSSA